MSSIRVPILNTNEFVEVFSDELSLDNLETVINLLRMELAPLKVWYKIAMEYYRQEMIEGFDYILGEVCENMPKEGAVYENYKSSSDFGDIMSKIHTSAAAILLQDISNFTDNPLAGGSKDSSVQKFIALLKLMFQDTNKDFLPLFRGFYELFIGNPNVASKYFSDAEITARKSKTANDSVFFATYLGLACVSYFKKDFEKSLKYLCDAVKLNPSCEGSVRIAIAACCIQLKKYDRSKFALQRAIELDPGNSNIWSLLSLIELLASYESLNNGDKQSESKKRSFEYAVMAYELDRYNPTARIQLALSALSSWNSSCSKCYVIDSRLLVFENNSSVKLSALDFVKLSDDTIFCVDSIVPLQSRENPSLYDQVSRELNASSSLYLVKVMSNSNNKFGVIPSELVGTCCEFNVREVSKAEELVRELLSRFTNPLIISEVHYVLGKCNQLRYRYSEAVESYKESLKHNSEMSLSRFELSRIYFSQHEFNKTEENLNILLKKFPNDKDCRGLSYLTRSLRDETKFAIDEISQHCMGSQFEYDVWVLQGFLYQKSKETYRLSLQCYSNAVQCSRFCGQVVSSAILGNMAVLSFSLGKFTESLSFFKKLFETLDSSNSRIHDSANLDVSFKNSEFENIFYVWKDISPSSLPISFDSKSGCYIVRNQALRDLYVGQELIVNDLIFVVVGIDREEDSYKVTLRQPYFLEIENGDYRIRVKEYTGLFNDENLTYCYNLGRVLEGLGKTIAATELFQNLLHIHPSFVECLIRMSQIKRSLGEFDSAGEFLQRVLKIDERNEDALLCLGDLQTQIHALGPARKSYDKIIKLNKSDSRALVSLGNICVADISSKSNDNLKESYKFYHHALAQERKDSYAATGLGIVCALKGLNKPAQEIFSKIREESIMNEDALANLAHVNVNLGHYADAEGLYTLSIKESLRTSKSDAKVFQRIECLCYSQVHHGQYTEALHNAQRSVHLDPMGMRAWFNIACIFRNLASNIKNPRMLVSLQKTKDLMEMALQIMNFLALNFNNYCQKAFAKEHLETLYEYCEGKLARVQKEIDITIHNRKIRLQQEAEAAAAAAAAAAAVADENLNASGLEAAVASSLIEGDSGNTSADISSMVPTNEVDDLFGTDESDPVPDESSSLKRSIDDLFGDDDDEEEEDNNDDHENKRSRH